MALHFCFFCSVENSNFFRVLLLRQKYKLLLYLTKLTQFVIALFNVFDLFCFALRFQKKQMVCDAKVRKKRKKSPPINYFFISLFSANFSAVLSTPPCNEIITLKPSLFGFLSFFSFFSLVSMRTLCLNYNA